MLICKRLIVNLNQPNWAVFSISFVADPDLRVISGGLRQGLAEPRRVVECTTGDPQNGLCCSKKLHD